MRGGQEERNEGAAEPITEATTRPSVDTSVAAAAISACRRTSRSSMRAVNLNLGVMGDAQHGAEDASMELAAGTPGW